MGGRLPRGLGGGIGNSFVEPDLLNEAEPEAEVALRKSRNRRRHFPPPSSPPPRNPHKPTVKSLFILLSLVVALPCLAQSRSRLPIMGWSSWNEFRVAIDEQIILGQADVMVSSGMQAVGYQYVNIDDGYFDNRNASGELQTNATKFPNGMKAVADYIHSQGLKAGIYSEAGTNTCGSIWDEDADGVGAGLLGHDKEDLTLMLQTWGYDFIKVDWCGGLVEGLDEKTRYTEIGRIVRRIRPDAVYNVCRWQYPGDWVKLTGDSWRISGDITATFGSVMGIVDTCEPLWIHCSPGHFNDMDMLQVGRGMTVNEDKAHFSMWCMMNSPLLAGNDLRTMDQTTIDILTNAEVIALNQDTLCYQARRLRDDGATELWAKPLTTRDSGDVAVTLLNRSTSTQTISFNLSEIGIDAAAGYSIRDLWLHQTLDTSSTNTSQSFSVAAHGVVVLRIAGQATENHPFTKPPGWNYSDWASETGLTVANSDPALDADGDGLSNLLEYAFEGFDPIHPDSPHTLTMATAEGQPFARFVRRNADDVVVTPEFQYAGLDANGWSPVVDGENGLSISEDIYGSLVTLLPGAEQSGFFRLAVGLDENIEVTTDANLSFEFPAVAAGTWSSTNPTNWSFTGPGGVENVDAATRYGSSGFGTSPTKLNGQGGDGDQVGYINLPSSGSTGSATSAIIATIAPETTYVLTIAFGQRSSGVKLPIGRFGLISSASELGSFTDVPGRSLGTGFHDFTYRWTSPAAGDPLIGQPLSIKIDFTYDVVLGGAQQAQFDHIRFTTGEFASIGITNGSFEDGPTGNGVPTGWTQTAGNSTIGVGAGGSSGSKYLWLGPGMEITQDLSHTLTAGEKLTLKYNSSRGSSGGYKRRIQLLAMSGGSYQLMAETTQQIGTSSWPTIQLDYIVEPQYSGQQLALRILNSDTGNWNEFDNFRLTVGTPTEGFLDGWNLVWREEFNGQSIDSNTWSKVERGSPDWKNTMTTAPKVFGIGDGRLHLKGFVNDDTASDPAPFLTGGLTSQGKYSFQYGKIVIRARFGSARGAWPALWLLGNQGGWPYNGELDLMEHLNYDTSVYQTVHSGYNYTGSSTQKFIQPTIAQYDYNTYGLEWDESKVVFTVNGAPTMTYSRDPAKGETQWPFKQPFYIILSMQIGGSWVGAGNPSDPNYPIDMEVDWIRVYEKN